MTMRIAIGIFGTVLALWAEGAVAHVGHFGDLAGHSHWIAVGAVGIAAAIGILGLAKGRARGDTTAAPAAAPTPEPEDAVPADGR